MSSLKVGIVGLPNSGKSTLLNVLAGEKIAKTAVTPFTTVAHNEAVVKVPESEVEKLGSSEIRFIDITGLVRGSSEGRGFGNAFLEKIRGVNILIHLVRAFYSNIISHPHKTNDPGSMEQIYEDIEVVKNELKLAGVHKPVIYVLNFDENKLLGVSTEYVANVEHKFGGPVMGLSAKLEEELIGMSEEDKNKRFEELKITESGLSKIIKQSCLLLEKNILN